MFHVKLIVIALLFFSLAASAQKMGSTTLEVKSLPPLPKPDLSIKELLASNAEYRQLSEKELEWFYWINYSRKNPRIFWDSVVSPLILTYPSFKGGNSASLRDDLEKLT